MDPLLHSYFSQIGRRGGQKSRRSLSPEMARRMVLVREARRAYQQFHTQCFWSFEPQYRITALDIPWVAKRLKEYGGREGWILGSKLCR